MRKNSTWAKHLLILAVSFVAGWLVAKAPVRGHLEWFLDFVVIAALILSSVLMTRWLGLPEANRTVSTGRVLVTIFSAFAFGIIVYLLVNKYPRLVDYLSAILIVFGAFGLFLKRRLAARSSSDQ